MFIRYEGFIRARSNKGSDLSRPLNMRAIEGRTEAEQMLKEAVQVEKFLGGEILDASVKELLGEGRKGRLGSDGDTETTATLVLASSSQETVADHRWQERDFSYPPFPL